MQQDSKMIRYQQNRLGKWETIEAGVIAEQAVSLTVNGSVWVTLICTPTDLEALAVGFLYNENIIESIDEVASVRPCSGGDNIDVWLNHPVELPVSWRRTSGCAGGITSAKNQAPKILFKERLALSPANISSLVEQLFSVQRLYRQVGEVHTSALSNGETIVASAEDIGRHNTLDKLAGWRLMEPQADDHTGNRHSLILLTTGRISSEMLQKAARLGCSIVISRTSPSSLSVELARQWGITLIGYARRTQFNIYTHPERVSLLNH